MRATDASLHRLFHAAAVLLLALCCGAAQARQVQRLTLETGATGTRAEILLDTPASYELLTLSGPDRLVVDFPDVGLPANLPLPAGSGVVSAVRTGHPVPGVTRIVFDLNAPIAVLQPSLEPTVEGARLVLQWPGDGAAAAMQPRTAATPAVASPPAVPAAAVATADPAAASAAATSRLIASLPIGTSDTSTSMTGSTSRSAPATSATSRARTPVPATVATGRPAPVPASPVVRQPAPAPVTQPAPVKTPVKTIEDVMRGVVGMRPLIIAIDAGHGGQDPGAIGKNGSREKDVVLEISRELARQIDATPGLKAYLTRDTDVFIPLNKRAKLARAAGADMFISIHANAARNRSADGSSVFVLSLRGASSQRARWLADKENAADMIGGVRLEKTNDTLASVLIDLTQSGQMKASRDAAEYVLDGLQQVGNVHKQQIEHANFAVLRTSDMPAMLVETAFISNPAEERQLSDPGFQSKIAAAVLDGVNTYFTRQPPPGTLYAARAAAVRARGAGGSAGSH